ncbi:coiled-coil domain-containing protein 191-like [Amphiura filiformis]|uniref:coiled-coil domain-containing protein 191-like n=1 Tax=Amphiura filiformis TaxID=82378 RepID=UPI003B213E62
MASSSSGSAGKSDLYRWKRWTRDKPAATPAPSIKKPSHTDDVQDWIKKVEAASDEAAAITFGVGKPRRQNNLLSGHGSAMATINVLQDHNEAYTEAQDLLSQWMAEKINLEDDNDNDIFDDDDVDLHMVSKRTQKTDLQNHWESMLEENEPGIVDPYNKVSSTDLFHEIESRDDSLTVDRILQGMLDKEVVEKTFKRDLGLNADKKKRKDPTVTMEARQKRVKENREKRDQEKQQQLKQRQVHKDAQLQARQMVMKEERQKALRRQREEGLIQQEMAKIRKEMQSQRLAVEETRNRQKEYEDAEREKIRLEEELSQRAEAEARLQAARLLEEERQELMLRAQELKAAKAAEDLKSLQRHFQAWYQLVVHRRLRMGKARAVSDWRCLVRAWNAWKAYVRACRAERETKEAEIYIKESHRKQQLAVTHNRQRILHKYFYAWQNWIAIDHKQQALHNNQDKTRSKMAAFLEAAATGKLWTNRNEDTIEGVTHDVKEEKSHRRPESKGNEIDDLFAQQTRKQDSARSTQSSARSERSDQSSACSESSSQGSSPARSHRLKGAPKFAWQVQRRHLNMTAEELANIGEPSANRNQNNAAPSSSPRPSSESSGTDRSKRSIQYRVNNFEHRYAAQQKILHDQQQQLREQQRLIEDLQMTQKQALFQRQLNNIREGNGAANPAGLDHVQDGDNPTSERTTSSARSEPDSSAMSTTRSDETEMSGTSNASQASSASKKPPTLKGMDERAAHRAKLKADREERQRKKEEERLAKIKEEQEKRIAAEEAEKKAKIERRKEEKRLAKQRELEKQQRLQHIASQNAKADEHYRLSIIRNYGFKPWKKLVHMSHQNMDKAIDYHSNILLRMCVLPWHQYTQEIKRGKLQVADDQYQYMLVRKCFSYWKKFGHYQSIQLQKARKHYITTLQVKTFSAWQDFVTNERIDRWRKEELATQHNTKRIMKIAFQALRQYPKTLKADRDREKRREEMRKKVASLIPDFGLS